jgi:hypothetical protein
MDIPDNLPDPAISRLLARLYDVADTLDAAGREWLRAALQPPFDRLSWRLETNRDPVVVAVLVTTEHGVTQVARFDAATIGISLDDKGGIYTPPTV